MTIPGSASSMLMAAAAAAPPAGYQIERSLRFNSSDSAYASKTFSSPTTQGTFTFAAWIKRAALGTTQHLFGVSTNHSFGFTSGDALNLTFAGSSALTTTALFRDPSAWYHIVWTQSGTSHTLYVNNVSVGTATATSSVFNTAVAHQIGAANTANYFNGYLADIHFIDGQALTPSSFTEVSATTGQLEPIDYTGSFGTNGFHLPFSDNSTAAALGTDTSGNGNNWIVNNLSVSSIPLTWTAVYVSGNNFYVPSPSDFANIVFSPNTSTSLTAIVANGNGTFHEVHLYPSTSITLGTTVLLAFGNGSGGDDTTNSGMSVEIDGVKVGQKAGSNYTSAGDYSSNFTGKVISQANPLKLTTRINGSFAAYVPGGNGVNPPLIRSDGVALLNTTGAGNDSLVDTPTSYGTDTGAGGEVRGNYCTWNPLDRTASTPIPLANGNLDVSGSGSGSEWSPVNGTIGMSSGKWYWEVTGSGTTYSYIGIAATLPQDGTGERWPGRTATSYGYYNSNGNKFNNNSGSSYGASYGSGDVVGVAFDADNRTLTFYKNGASQGTAFTSIPAGTYFPCVSTFFTSATQSTNFGQRPFAYAAPSGFKALCDTNLPAPVVAKPNEVMDVKLYTGNGGTQTISGLGFSPDLVWIKNRTLSQDHMLQDQVRGATAWLSSNRTAAENTNTSSDWFRAFTSDGFTVAYQTTGGLATNEWNASGSAYTAWAWDAGSSTVTNTQGSISSQVRANASAGFSIVTISSATGSAGATIGHGLGVTPALIIQKARTTTYSWNTYFNNNGTWIYLVLNDTSASSATTTANMGTTPTSTTMGLGSNFSGSHDYVYYCFAPVAGYSSFGSYTGNGSADGPFVFTGMRPRWIMWKKTNSSTNAPWVIVDTARSSYNLAREYLLPNASDAETSVDLIDVLSNGFKWRGTAPGGNASGDTYIYAAFAEHPFAYARAR